MKTSKKASRKAAIAIEPPATTGTDTNTNPTVEPVAPEAANAAPQTAHPARAKAATTRKATARKGAARGKKTAGKPVSRKVTKPQQVAAREGTKKATIIDMLRRKTGATVAEVEQFTGWQKHSIRGFLSGTVSKKMGLKVESTRTEAGRNYRIITR